MDELITQITERTGITANQAGNDYGSWAGVSRITWWNFSSLPGGASPQLG